MESQKELEKTSSKCLTANNSLKKKNLTRALSVENLKVLKILPCPQI